MALRWKQEHIAQDANNIAPVEDEGNIVSIEGNIFLYPPKKSHPILIIILYIWFCVSSYFSKATCHFSVYKQRRAIFRSQNIPWGIMFLNMRRFALITLLPSLSQSAWNTRFYFGH